MFEGGVDQPTAHTWVFKYDSGSEMVCEECGLIPPKPYGWYRRPNAPMLTKS